MTNDELTRGVTGKLSLRAAGSTESISGAKLQFDQEIGATLEFTTSKYAHGPIEELRGEFGSCSFWFDGLNVRSIDALHDGGAHVRCIARRMVSAYGIEQPEGHLCQTTAIPIDHLDRYWPSGAM